MAMLELAEGGQLYYQWIAAGDGAAVGAGAASQPVLVFLHEGLGCAAMWKDFPARLCAQTGCQGLVFDRLGYGQSSPLRTGRSVHYLHRYALEELPQVLALLDGRPYVVLGHSDGGSIALIHAADQPSGLLGVVTEAAHVFVEEVTLAGIREARAAYGAGKLRGLSRYHGDKTDQIFGAWADTWLRQVQVNPRIGWTFAAAMRTFLRADPDVIMIGEMRDEETSRIAIEASLTGHLVLSTLHTNSAPESIARLLEIGLDPFNFSDSLLAILAQRLVRRLCKACREPVVADDETLLGMASQYLPSGSGNSPEGRAALVQRWRNNYGTGSGELQLWSRVGCQECEGHGYRGRLGIHELMLSDEAIRQHIRRRASAAEIRQAALAAGMLTLRQDGIEKVLRGLTDMPEVLAASNL
eukprot:gene41994-52054_t